MNFQRSTSSADNAASARLGIRKTALDSQAAVRCAREDYSRQSDQQDFARLLSNLKDGGDNDEFATVSDSAGDTLEDALDDKSTQAESSEGSEELPFESLEASDYQTTDPLEDNYSQLEGSTDEHLSTANENPGLALFSFDAPVDVQHTNHAESGATETGGTLPAGEAAARIIEELQNRARRSEAKRWQFSLPGLLDGEVLVTVEKLEDQSWVVELSTRDECSDEERLQLKHRLADRLGDVVLSTSLL